MSDQLNFSSRAVDVAGTILVRSRKWLVTVNNPTIRPPLTKANLFDGWTNGLLSASAQYERGLECGTPHVHICFHVQDNFSGQMVKNHFQRRFGVAGNVRKIGTGFDDYFRAFMYCLKEETRDCTVREQLIWNMPTTPTRPAGRSRGVRPTTNPTPKKSKKDEIYEILFNEYDATVSWDTMMDQLRATSPEKHLLICGSCPPQMQAERRRWVEASKPKRKITNVIVLYGWPGTGKSTYAEQMFSSLCPDESKYDVSNWLWKQQSHLGSFFGSTGSVRYNDQPGLLFDEYSGYAYGQKPPFDLDNLLIYTDVNKHAPVGNVKCGAVQLNYNTVILTSNVHPMKWFAGTFRTDPMKWKALRRRITKLLFFPKTTPDGTTNVYDGQPDFNPFFYDESEDEISFDEETLAYQGIKSATGELV